MGRSPISHLSLSRPKISPTATPYTSAMATAINNVVELYIIVVCIGLNNSRELAIAITIVVETDGVMPTTDVEFVSQCVKIVD